MTSMDALSALFRAFFALWALLLCLAGIGGVILPLRKRRYLYSVLALVCFAIAYFMWQVLFDIALYYRLGIRVSAVTETLGGIAWAWWLVVFLALTAFSVLLLRCNIRYERNHVTLGSVKKYLDQLPCGVCCWEDNGRVLFANICVNELCVAITGEQLLNGNHFYEVAAGKMLSVDGKMWRFTARDITIGKQRLREMIASDVTSEYAKTLALEEDKAELDRLNRELKEYNRNIDETVRRQEILQAKVNIHDEMNRLMLSTVSAENANEADADDIFALWEQNALLLCMQANETTDKNASDRIKALAESLKIRLDWQGDLPTILNERQRNLFFSAAQEAVANAAKHANAKTLIVSFLSGEGMVECRFTSDGKMPVAPVVFSGGLSNLDRLAAKQGATLKAEAKETFTLSLVFRVLNQPIS